MALLDKSEWLPYQWYGIFEKCPNCGKKITLSPSSVKSKIDLIEQAMDTAKLHKKICNNDSKNRIFNLSINVKLRKNYAYMSSWENNHKIYI